jgi:hypothetical protein
MHGFWNRSGRDARILILCAVGLEAFFEEASTRVEASDRLARLRRRSWTVFRCILQTLSQPPRPRNRQAVLILLEIVIVNSPQSSTKRATSERAVIRVVVMSLVSRILASRCSFCFSLHKRNSSFKTLTPFNSPASNETSILTVKNREQVREQIGNRPSRNSIEHRPITSR